MQKASFPSSCLLTSFPSLRQTQTHWKLVTFPLLPGSFFACVAIQSRCLVLIVAAVCVLSRFSRVRLFVTPWTLAHQVLCPWDSPGQNTGVGCHALLQGIFLILGLNLSLLPSCIAGGFFIPEPPRKPYLTIDNI